MKIDILGTSYTILKRSGRKDERLSECDGYCDWTTKEIVLEQEEHGNLGDMLFR